MVDSVDYALVLLSQMDRVARQTFPLAQENMSMRNRVPHANNPALGYWPLCLDTRPETLQVLTDLLAAAAAPYLSPAGKEAAPSEQFTAAAYCIMPVLRILKVRLWLLLACALNAGLLS